MIESPYLASPGKRFKLDRIKTDDRGDFKDKQAGEEDTAKNVARVRELQEILYAQGTQALLIVLQGMDTSGKDGAIEHVFGAVNPQGCQVTSFKVPTALEHAHDYLWRIHEAVPPAGMIGIFNRSHYESVLVERVRNLVPKEVWSGRYDQINEFEKMLASEGVTILKFYLHISKQEQRAHLEDRLKDATKQWKFNPNDLRERKLWDSYTEAYEDLVEKCSTRHAPWYIVPADRKWFRNWVLSDTIARAMKSMKLKYPPPVEGIEKYKVE